MSLKNTSVKISILGCGWLGFPLAMDLIRQGYQVKGSTTTPRKIPALKEAGIKPFLLDLKELPSGPEIEEFLDADILVLNIPPKRGSGNDYLSQLHNLKERLRDTPVKKVLFVSSTSVYAPSTKTITETSALDPQNDLVAAEKLFSAKENPWETTVLRLAGLFGPGRQPGRFLAGKTGLPDPELPINLIHLEDCLGIISEIIKQDKWQEVFNGCADGHPTRREFYVAAARKLNLPEPVFTEPDPNSIGKRISNQKAKAQLHYSFKFSDPLAAI